MQRIAVEWIVQPRVVAHKEIQTPKKIRNVVQAPPRSNEKWRKAGIKNRDSIVVLPRPPWANLRASVVDAKGLVCVCVFFSNTPFPRKVSCAPQHERSMLASFTEDFLKETSQEQAAMATKTPMEKGCKMQICRCQPLQNASETLYSVL